MSLPTQEELVALAGPVGAREFAGAEEWAKEKTWAEMQAIPAMDDCQFLDAAECAIVASAFWNSRRGNHEHEHALCTAFYHQAALRNMAAGHDEECRGPTLYGRAHNNAMRSQRHRPTRQGECHCDLRT
jgi:hypothetical protein